MMVGGAHDVLYLQWAVITGLGLQWAVRWPDRRDVRTVVSGRHARRRESYNNLSLSGPDIIKNVNFSYTPL